MILWVKMKSDKCSDSIEILMREIKLWGKSIIKLYLLIYYFEQNNNQ